MLHTQMQPFNPMSTCAYAIFIKVKCSVVPNNYRVSLFMPLISERGVDLLKKSSRECFVAVLVRMIMQL